MMINDNLQPNKAQAAKHPSSNIFHLVLVQKSKGNIKVRNIKKKTQKIEQVH